MLNTHLTLSTTAAPTGFDQVIVERIESRSVLLSWEAPAQPNGVLVAYKVLEDGQEIANVSSQTVEFNVTGLLPYTVYQFSILACTLAGCVEGPSVETMTLEDGMCLWLCMSPSIISGSLLQYRRV